jgi:hypothetical protein
MLPSVIGGPGGCLGFIRKLLRPGKQSLAAGFFYVGLNYRCNIGRNGFVGELFAQLAAVRFVCITRRDR